MPLLSIVNSCADHFAIRSSCQSPWAPMMRGLALGHWRTTTHHQRPSYLFTLLGVHGTEAPRIIAIIPPADLHTVFTRWQIPNAAGVAQWLNLGQAGTCARTCRFLCGMETRATPPSVPAVTPATTTNAREVNLYQVINQADEDEVDILDQAAALPIATGLVVSRRKARS